MVGRGHMAGRLNRGELWMFSFKKPDKQRPVLILTRQEVIEMLNTVMVAPITSTIHGAPSEVIIGVAEGLKHDSAVNLDHIQTVEKARLRRYVGVLNSEKMKSICRAIGIATGCI